MMSLSHFLFGTLRGRLIVGVAVVHAVMMALFIIDLTARQRAMLLDRQIEAATALSQTLATSAAGWIAANDIAGLQELVEAQRRYPELLFAILADQEGRVLADTDKSRQELYMLDLPDAAHRTVLTSTPALVDVAAPAMLGGHQVGWARVGIGQKKAGEKLAAITRNGVAYALAAIIIGSLIAWFMGHGITRRLYAVQKTIAAVRAGNRLARASLSGTDEAAAIAQDFNQMLEVIVESEENLNRAQAVAQTGSWYLDIRHNKLTWSAETHRMFKIPPGQPLTLETFAACILPEDRDMVLKAWDEALRGAPYDIEHRILAGDEIRWIRERAEVLFDPAGNALTGIGTVQDITERKQAEQNIALLSFALNNVREAAFLIDENARFRYVNEESCHILGYSQDELLGLGVADVDPDFPAGRWPDHWQKLKTKHSLTFEGCHKNKAGNIFPVEVNANYFEYDGQGYNLAMVRDITERKRAEEALRKSEEFNRNILATVDEGFIVVDRDYRIISANRAFCDMAQSSAEQVVGRFCFEISHRTDHFCFDSGEECAVKTTFETGTPHFAIHTHKNAAGAEQYVELKAFPVVDASSTVVSVIETITDVTEKRKLEEQLRQAQKLEAVGTLAGGVAHDFNNMLMVILGHAEIALLKLAPDQPFFADLQEIRKAAERSAELTRQLLTFARKQTVTPQVIDINQTMETMLMMLRRLIGEDIDLAWQPGPEIWPIKADPSQIDQILANLCVNARDAIAGVGKITIETRNEIVDESYCADHPEAVPGEYLLLTVSDDGCGMDRQIMAKIFEPFFTTKELGQGTGLGLATVYGIAKQNQGFINVYSEPGQGSTFKIYLPRHVGKGGEMPNESPATLAVGGHETILLAEDEAAILAMVKRILEDFGYRVLAASTPGEAIRMAKNHSGEIHLLITDVVMPEMNGQELAKNLLALHPRLRSLYMSGYSGNVIAHHGVLDEGVNFIQKPFSMQAIAAKVRAVLDRK